MKAFAFELRGAAFDFGIERIDILLEAFHHAVKTVCQNPHLIITLNAAFRR